MKERKRLLSGEALRAVVEKRARALGFDAFGIARPDSVPELRERLSCWLEAGHHGDMDWMASRTDERAEPAALWPEIGSVVMLGMNASPATDPLAALAHKDRGAIATYAQRRDYHEVVKGKLKELGGFLKAKSGCEVKVFTDTAPVMEKPLAQAAGLGWQGKHSVLISRERGNWLLLGAIYTTAVLAPDGPAEESCGNCRRCLDICPTSAFAAPFVVDARRCISYLTIEHEGPIPTEFRAAIGNRVFGCDDCLAVCPWNKFASAGREARMAVREDLSAPPLRMLAGLDDAGFRAFFSATPIKRTGRDRFLRNVLIAIGNSGDPDFAGDAERHLRDPNPIVRGAAIWACGRLNDTERLAQLHATHAARESDAQVVAEWQQALAAPSCEGRSR